MPSPKSVQKKIAKAVDMTMEKVITNFGNDVFKECQKRVPSKSGVLKDSGSVKQIKGKGIEIRYSAPHAWDVHNGSEGNPGFTWTSDIKRHKRRLANGGTTTVKRHKKRYIGYKPSVSEDTWYMRNMNNPSDGRPWMEVAYETVKGKQPKWLRRLLPRKMDIHSE